MSSERPVAVPADRRGYGDLFVVSAPSGAGKTTVIRALFAEHDFGGNLYYSVSHTTRPRRRDEVEGVDYHFVDEPTFRRMAAGGEFLEWAEVHGQLKGTCAAPILERLALGIDVLVDIDVQGAAQVLERYPPAQAVFIMPPSFAELERRLRGRGLDTEVQIARRLVESSVEIRCYRNYHYVMINERVEHVTRALAAVINARRHRRERIQAKIDRVLAGFPEPRDP